LLNALSQMVWWGFN